MPKVIKTEVTKENVVDFYSDHPDLLLAMHKTFGAILGTTGMYKSFVSEQELKPERKLRGTGSKAGKGRKSGYNMFMKEQFKELKDKKGDDGEKMEFVAKAGVVSGKWKAMTDDEKEKYKDIAKKENDENVVNSPKEDKDEKKKRKKDKKKKKNKVVEEVVDEDDDDVNVADSDNEELVLANIEDSDSDSD